MNPTELPMRCWGCEHDWGTERGSGDTDLRGCCRVCGDFNWQRCPKCNEENCESCAKARYYKAQREREAQNA